MTTYDSEITPTNNDKRDMDKGGLYARLGEACEEVKEKYLPEAALDQPLTEDGLPDEVRTSESFLAFVESEGWPSEADSTVDRRLHHDSAEDFWSNFIYENGVPPSDKNPNNFRVWLATEPVVIPEGNTLADLMSGKIEGVTPNGMEVLYGLNPALHRAYAIAGDLMENLRAYYSELRTVPGGIDARMDQLSKDGDAHAELKEATYTAYLLLNRLIAKDDFARAMEKIGADGEEEITDAYRALTR